jgi:hypothetical protein
MTRSRLHALAPGILAMLSVAACGATTPGGPGMSQPAGTLQAAPTPAEGSSVADGSSLVAAAAAVTDVCPLVPMDLVASIVPDASAPQSQTYPPYRCTISNGTSVVEVTIAAYDAVDPLIPNERVAGLGAVAYLQEQQPDNAYLKVVLDPAGGAIYVEVAGHDGKDHADDAIAIARRVLDALQ